MLDCGWCDVWRRYDCGLGDGEIEDVEWTSKPSNRGNILTEIPHGSDPSFLLSLVLVLVESTESKNNDPGISDRHPRKQSQRHIIQCQYLPPTGLLNIVYCGRILLRIEFRQARTHIFPDRRPHPINFDSKKEREAHLPGNIKKIHLFNRDAYCCSVALECLSISTGRETNLSLLESERQYCYSCSHADAPMNPSKEKLTVIDSLMAWMPRAARNDGTWNTEDNGVSHQHVCWWGYQTSCPPLKTDRFTWEKEQFRDRVRVQKRRHSLDTERGDD